MTETTKTTDLATTVAQHFQEAAAMMANLLCDRVQAEDAELYQKVAEAMTAGGVLELALQFHPATIVLRVRDCTGYPRTVAQVPLIEGTLQ